jgi:hypothetical protein
MALPMVAERSALEELAEQAFLQCCASSALGSRYSHPLRDLRQKHIASGTWDGTYGVTVYFGVVNGCLPSNMFDVSNVAITSTQFVVLNCVSSSGLSITSAS